MIFFKIVFFLIVLGALSGTSAEIGALKMDVQKLQTQVQHLSYQIDTLQHPSPF